MLRRWRGARSRHRHLSADEAAELERVQRAQCELVGTHFAPPRAHQLISVDEGVEDGAHVEGVRYPAPDHMSGWYVTTERYDGDVSSLRHECYACFCGRCPRLARVLALPAGHRFDTSAGEINFSAEIAAEPPS